MIVRIMGEGQLDVADASIDDLNRLDDRLAAAIESGDDTEFRSALDALLAAVRSLGQPVAADSLVDSELILPYADAHIDEVRDMLNDDGLIPG